MKYMYLNTLNFIRSKENRIFLIYLLAVIIGSLYFIVILVGIFNNCVPNLNIILVFFTDLSISFLTSLIIILVYLLNKKNKIYLVISVFLIVVIIGVISFNIVELVNFLPLIFLAILAVFLLIMEVFKKLSYLYFEWWRIYENRSKEC